MGLRGELFSTRVILQNRSYFFNVKENRMGDLYLNIVESKNRDEGGFSRQSVILFSDDLQEFLKGFDEALRILEKEVRARRRGGNSVIRNTADDDGGKDRFDGGKRRERESGGGRYGEKRRGREFDSGGREFTEPAAGTRRSFGSQGRRNESPHPPQEKPRKGRPPKDGKRVVVRKK